MKKLSKFMMAITMMALVLGAVQVALAPAAPVVADTIVDPIPGGNLPSKPLPEVVGSIVNIILSITGIILFILFFYGGFLILTAAGDDEKVGQGKKIIIQAVIGLLVVLVSYAASQYVINKLLGATGAGSGTSTGGTR